MKMGREKECRNRAERFFAQRKNGEQQPGGGPSAAGKRKEKYYVRIQKTVYGRNCSGMCHSDDAGSHVCNRTGDRRCSGRDLAAEHQIYIETATKHLMGDAPVMSLVCQRKAFF